MLQATYKEGLALHRKGELDRAEALYRRVLAAMPRSFHALHMLGVLRGQRDDLAGSERLLAQAVDVDPGVAAAHANLGNARRLLDRLDEAMQSYDRALALAPDNSRALKGRGIILWMRNERQQALDCYTHLLSVEPDYSDGWIMKAACLTHLKRPDEAAAAYRTALGFENVTNPDKIRYVLAAMGQDEVPAASPLQYVRDLFDKYAADFESHLVGELHYRAPDFLAARLQPLLGADRIDILDLGCGTGLCGRLLKPWARSLAGLDVSARMLAEAAEKEVYDTLVEAEITAWLPTRRADFDLVVATDVFIYIGDLAPVFAAAAGALRPGGRFAFSVEENDRGDFALRESLRYAHSAAYLERLAAEGGWTVESLTRKPLREEQRAAVDGLIVILRRPWSPAS